ncbi:WGR domain-containing protein [Actinokineospora alba]|uniref:WGR domain-containing protein n=1 Tax=Actinokineospora alba TaxID=504798 RepID=A0A1H0HLD9_9PSEU|nr:DUF4132 domain-containing protein [Actinokineospora alba]TDP64845.1 WGR domain-containing protein [Actinokineospora alba]SDH47349.1 WGR domain-containing protein [Actinokineospora alba]SDO19843.1 WGR domain-containing protein [Actinokineospora alba]
MRLEFVGDGSAKFWEGELNGCAVTVRWGRIGTAGQSQVKEFATTDAAQAHLDKVAADKVRKGYQEAGAELAPVVAAVPVAPAEPAAIRDENTFVPPSALGRGVHLRRGDGRGARALVRGASETIRELLKEQQSHVSFMLRHLGEDATAAYPVYVDGAPDPLGGGAVLVSLAACRRYLDETKVPLVADAWLAEHGVVFATSALMEAAGLQGDHNAMGWPHGCIEAAGRVRAALATATDEEYTAAVSLLAGKHQHWQPIVAAFIAPTETALVEAVLRDAPKWDARRLGWQPLMVSAISTREQFDSLLPLHSWHISRSPKTLATLVETLRGDVVAEVVEWSREAPSEERRKYLAQLAEIPTDEAFGALLGQVGEKYVAPVLMAAMKRYPLRALRMLAAEASPAAAALLRGHLLAHPHLVDQVVELPDGARQSAEAMLEGTKRLPDATDLPSLLVTPPWTTKRVVVKPLVVAGLSVPDELRDTVFDWLPGERESWTETPLEYTPFHDLTGWESVIHKYKSGTLHVSEQYLFAQGPPELTAPLLRDWQPGWLYGLDEWGRRIAAGYGRDGVEFLLRNTSGNPAAVARLLVPARDPAVAAAMAQWLVTAKSVRPAARAWFARHGPRAVPLLVPDAVGVPAGRRGYAEAALRLIAGSAGVDAVVEAAAVFGAEAVAAVRAVLAVDPLTVLPARLPVIGDWADPLLLPQIRSRAGDTGLPIAATRHVLTILSLGKAGEPYAGVEILRAWADPASLAEFVWGLFRQWQQVEMPPKDGWVMTALGLFGDDDTVRSLAPVIRIWPGEGRHQLAVTGLDVLAEIGTDVALMHLNGIANKVKFKGLKTKAQEKISEVAANLGLSADELADRLVPDFGLDAEGALVIDYGPRRFTVGFDEHLKPFVRDADGKQRKDLPKPGAKDDPDIADAAHKRFAALKKDVRTVAADQIIRLEKAMTARRRWTGAQFHELFVAHPLLWHVSRRLVWGVYEDGALVGGFRLAEDRTLADVEDDTISLADDAVVGIAHPVDLGSAATAWSEVFADYEILQPFAQLGRPVYSADVPLEKFVGVTVTTGKVLGLIRRGWERGEPQDAGVEVWISKPLPDNQTAVINLDPGIAVGALDVFPEQKLESVWLNPGRGGDWSRNGRVLPLEDLDPITVSELIADLMELTEL